MALAQDHPEAYAVCYQKAVDRLHRVGAHSPNFSPRAHEALFSWWLNTSIRRNTRIIGFQRRGYK